MGNFARQNASLSILSSFCVIFLLLKVVEEESCHATLEQDFGHNKRPEVVIPDAISSLNSHLSASDVTFYNKKDGSLPTEYSTAFCQKAKLLCGEKTTKAEQLSQACNAIYHGQFARTCAGDKRNHPLNIGFFRERELATGNIFKLPVMTDSLPDKSFLPRALASKISFNSHQLGTILRVFRIPAQSPLAKRMITSLDLCETRAMKDETKTCSTSLESMVEYARRQLGSRMKAISPSVGISGRQGKVLGISRKENSMVGSKSVACHSLASPFRVYFCHEVKNTRVIKVVLEMEKGEVKDGVALCHLDTSNWESSHPAFASLNSKPGRGEACHWIFERNLVWIPII